MSNAFSGIGTKLQMGDGGTPTETFSTIAEVISINWSGRKLDLADVTNMDSTGNYREFLPTLFDAGEVTIEANYIPSAVTQQNVLTNYEARTKTNFKIILPPAATPNTWSFSGYWNETGIDVPLDKQAKSSLKIKLTGKPTIA